MASVYRYRIAVLRTVGPWDDEPMQDLERDGWEFVTMAITPCEKWAGEIRCIMLYRKKENDS